MLSTMRRALLVGRIVASLFALGFISNCTDNHLPSTPPSPSATGTSSMPCSVDLQPSIRNVPAAASFFYMTSVEYVPEGCHPVSATDRTGNAPWMTSTFDDNLYEVHVAANPGSDPRTGTLAFGDARLTVIQDGAGQRDVRGLTESERSLSKRRTRGTDRPQPTRWQSASVSVRSMIATLGEPFYAESARTKISGT
jgi:hypothetical protein